MAPAVRVRSQAVTSGPRVLVVSANEVRAQQWSVDLREHGLNVHTTATLWAARDHLAAHAIDVVLADSDLPSDGALTLARSFCSGRFPPLLILGRDDLVDRVVAVELGADDLLPREMDTRELVARIRTLARTQNADDRIPSRVCWRLRSELRVLEAPNGRSAALSATQWQLLVLLAESNGRPVNAQTAAAAIPSFRDNPDASLRTGMSRLRRRVIEKIGSAPISSAYGLGYTLDAPVILTANDT